MNIQMMGEWWRIVVKLNIIINARNESINFGSGERLMVFDWNWTMQVSMEILMIIKLFGSWLLIAKETEKKII